LGLPCHVPQYPVRKNNINNNHIFVVIIVDVVVTGNCLL
jgi:hypothetical protein